jgi:GNAT superfamily N-acetyltransferase
MDARDVRAGADEDGSPSIIIRPFEPRDSAAVAAIWVGGLQQTIDSTGGLMSLLMQPAMAWLKRSATAADGDVGPDGANLAAHWCSHDGRQMLVATMDSGVVVGCCGVIRGTDEKKSAPTGCDVCSVWRLSVAETARRRGVAMALMRAAEDWARKEGASSIRLVTGNHVAATFYVERMRYERPGWRWDQNLPRYDMWFEKKLNGLQKSSHY